MSNDAERLTKAEQVIRTLIETLKEDGQFGLDVVTDALDFLRSGQPVFQPTERGELISQLRHALYLAESPVEDVVEFELGDTDFSFNYS
jgi:hypothetical protein